MDPTEINLTIPPYPTLMKQQRFRGLVEKYRQKEEG